MLKIIEIGDIAWQGKTEPVFCRAEDGHEYVVKGSFAGRKALIAEWVANRLGRMLNLPIPEFAQMRLDPQLLKYSIKTEEVARLGKGVLFGSKRLADLVEIRQTDLVRVDLNLQARVLAFDWWIANSDRVFIDGRGNPNLLWLEEYAQLVVIDHNLAFDPGMMGDFGAEHAFREARGLWTEAFRATMSREFRQALAELPAIWRELPEEWTEEGCGLTYSEVESLLWNFDREPGMFWSLT